MLPTPPLLPSPDIGGGWNATVPSQGKSERGDALKPKSGRTAELNPSVHSERLNDPPLSGVGKGATMTTKLAKVSNRGSKPGERRGGRQKGVPNHATASLKDMAREYTSEALLTLADIMRSSAEPAAARVAASNALLDRGYGKPSQVIAGDEESPLAIVHRIELTG